MAPHTSTQVFWLFSVHTGIVTVHSVHTGTVAIRSVHSGAVAVHFVHSSTGSRTASDPTLAVSSSPAVKSPEPLRYSASVSV